MYHCWGPGPGRRQTKIIKSLLLLFLRAISAIFRRHFQWMQLFIFEDAKHVFFLNFVKSNDSDYRREKRNYCLWYFKIFIVDIDKFLFHNEKLNHWLCISCSFLKYYFSLVDLYPSCSCIGIYKMGVRLKFD